MSTENQVSPTSENGQRLQRQGASSSAATQSAQQQPQQQRSVLPAVDIFENESSITLLADMPGVPKEQLELKVEGHSLSIEGTARPATPEGLEPLWAEFRVPRYQRSFNLSRELDTARIEAHLKDGVLTLRIPKQAHAQPRRIEVSAG